MLPHGVDDESISVSSILKASSFGIVTILAISLFSAHLAGDLPKDIGDVLAAGEPRIEWGNVSSSSGGLPVPQGSDQQTASLVLDINKDGLQDFVIASRRSSQNSVVWYKRTASGWEQSILEPGGLQIEAGGDFYDIDGDGDLDISFAGDNQDNSIWWWENPYPNYSANRWDRHVIKNTGAKKHHDQLFGDVDGDGKAELVYWNQGESGLYVSEIPANPKSSGEWPRSKIFTSTPEHEGLQLYDIDGDGKKDIVGAGSWWKHNTGFSYTRHIIDDSQRFTRTAVGQLKAGGLPEVIFVPGDADGKLRYYEWNGTNWIGKNLIPEDVIHGHSLEIADFDGDGLLDIYVGEMRLNGANANAKQRLFYGDGNGNFEVQEISSGYGVHEGKIGDLDGDGDVDILAKPYNWNTPRIDVWLNSNGSTNGVGLNQWVRHVIDPNRPWRSVLVKMADLNGDGAEDVATGGFWYTNPQDVNAPSWPRNSIGGNLNNVAALMDVDSDGDVDIIGTTGGGGGTNNVNSSDFILALNNGSGDFTHSVIGSGVGDFVQGAEIGRYTAGAKQIAISWHNGGNGVQIFTIPSNPTNQWNIQTLNGLGQDEDLSAGDIDRDGDIDILTGTKWLENNGGSWITHTLFNGSGDPDRNELVDMNGDGRLDAVVGYEAISTNGKIAWYEQPISATAIWAEHIIANITGPMSLDVADMDGDGDPDVVAGEHNLNNPGSAKAYVFENADGIAGSWTEYIVYTGDEHHDGTQVADIDGDGDKDIVTIGWNNKVVAWYENASETTVIPTPEITPSISPVPTPIHGGGYQGNCINADTYEAVEDTHINSFLFRQEVNYGRDQEVTAAGTPENIGLLKFDLRNTAPDSFDCAVVRMRVHEGIFSGTNDNVRLYKADSNWDQNTVTYETRPFIEQTFYSEYTEDVSASGNEDVWIEIDATEYVKEKAGQFVTIAFKTSGIDDIKITSIEGGNPAELILQTQDVIEPGPDLTTQPGDVYKEFDLAQRWGTNDWRVTGDEACPRWDEACGYLKSPTETGNPLITINVDDLVGATRAEIVLDEWGGHNDTKGKKFRINGSSWINLPKMDTTPQDPWKYYYETNPIIPIDLNLLRQGNNTFEGDACCNWWPQWGWMGIKIRVFYDPAVKNNPVGSITSPTQNSAFSDNPTITIDASANSGVEKVDVLGWYYDYDENGDGYYLDWHRGYFVEERSKQRTEMGTLKYHIGTDDSAPYSVRWDTEWVPDQQPNSVKIIARIKGNNGYWYVTNKVEGLSLTRNGNAVHLFPPVASSIPPKYGVRNGQTKSSTVMIPVDPANFSEAVAPMRNWNGQMHGGSDPHGTFEVNDVFTGEVNGRNHVFSHTNPDVDVEALVLGENEISFSSTTVHHDNEILWPGPAIKAKEGTPKPEVLACIGAGWDTAGVNKVDYPKTCTHYVATNGNDGASGTSVGSPWRNIHTAVSKAPAGATICVRGGTYDYPYNNPIISMTKGEQRLTNFEQEEVILKGVGLNNQHGYRNLIQISSSENIVENLYIRAFPQDVLRVINKGKGANNNIIRNNEIHQAGKGQIAIQGSINGQGLSGNKVINNILEYCRLDPVTKNPIGPGGQGNGGVDCTAVRVGGARNSSQDDTATVISGNIISNSANHGMIIDPNAGLTRGVIVQNNLILDAHFNVHGVDDMIINGNAFIKTSDGKGVNSGLNYQSFEEDIAHRWNLPAEDIKSYDVRITNNIFSGQGTPLLIHAWHKDGQIVNMVVKGNTIIGGDTNTMRINYGRRNPKVPAVGDVNPNNIFKNSIMEDNIFYKNKASSLVWGNQLDTSRPPTGLTVRNNIWSENPGGFDSDPIIANPKLAGAPEGGIIDFPSLDTPYAEMVARYLITPGSPAYDAAIDNQLTTDVLRGARPAGGSNDIGAHELGATLADDDSCEIEPPLPTNTPTPIPSLTISAADITPIGIVGIILEPVLINDGEVWFTFSTQANGSALGESIVVSVPFGDSAGAIEFLALLTVYENEWASVSGNFIEIDGGRLLVSSEDQIEFLGPDIDTSMLNANAGIQINWDLVVPIAITIIILAAGGLIFTRMFGT